MKKVKKMDLPKKLNQRNIDNVIRVYEKSLSEIPLEIKAHSVFELAESIKRKPLESGPYKNVSLFESLNRIMTDCIILSGVKKLLIEKKINGIELPFNEYQVQYGAENSAEYDLYAETNNFILIGEVFNVSKRFFQAKKTKMLKKLRSSKIKYNLLVIMCNSDSFENGYKPKLNPNEMFFPVDLVFRIH